MSSGVPIRPIGCKPLKESSDLLISLGSINDSYRGGYNGEWNGIYPNILSANSIAMCCVGASNPAFAIE